MLVKMKRQLRLLEETGGILETKNRHAGAEWPDASPKDLDDDSELAYRRSSFNG